MSLNEYGQIAHNCWKEIPKHFSNVDIDEFIVMPNHVHGIIIIVGAGLALPKSNQGAASSAPTVGDIIRVFKSISAIKVNRIPGRTGIPFWQLNYYEHIIRNDVELNRIREYIQNNSLQWHLDRENPQKTGNNPITP